jgi:hypothetical protein
VWQSIRDAVQEHPLDYGESTRVRHDACEHRSNGQTLDIERVDHGYIGYCHRCGIGDMYFATTTNHKKPKGRAVGANKGGFRKSQRTSDLNECPIQVRLWLNKSRISTELLARQGVKWNNTLERLEFPVPGHTQTVNRNYGHDSTSGKALPKYTSRVPYQLRHRQEDTVHEREKSLIVVEDWMSSLQCCLAGYSSLALFTTSIKQEALVLCAKHGYTRIVIALDHDNVTVIANERKAKRQFSLFHNNVQSVELQKDPKEYTITELQEILG